MGGGERMGGWGRGVTVATLWECVCGCRGGGGIE